MERREKGKEKDGWRWAHHRGEQAMDGKGRVLARAKDAIEYVCICISEGQRQSVSKDISPESLADAFRESCFRR